MNSGPAAHFGDRETCGFRPRLQIGDDCLLVHDANDISIIATWQQQSCKVSQISSDANWFFMEGLESDTELVRALAKHARMAPSTMAKEIGAAATTLLRPYKGKAETRLSQPTLDKLRRRWPDFPGWRTELPDQIGMHGERPDPNERTDELVYVRSVDISLAMGEAAVVEDHPATELVPFNLGFIRGVTRANTDDLLIMSGHGESMEPTLLRSDLLMIDTSQKVPIVSDQIWAFHYAGGGMIKRLRRIRDGGEDRLLILSDNPQVPDQVAEIDDVHVIGKLVWVGRRM